MIDEAKRQAVLEDMVKKVTNEVSTVPLSDVTLTKPQALKEHVPNLHATLQYQYKIGVEQQAMEQQSAVLKARQTELLDRFLSIKGSLQAEMEESISYVQRLASLAAAESGSQDDDENDPTNR